MTDQITALLNRVNATATDYPRGSSLHELVSEQARATPDRIVFEAGDTQLSYAELDTRSNQLAWYLSAQGVQSGSLVGLCCERNTDTAIALIGILKSGAGYVPLDPDYPIDRLQYMVDDSALELVVSHKSLAGLASDFGNRTVFLDADQDQISAQQTTPPSISIDPETHVAYVIYTSGSTGKPKGVMVPHRCAVNLLWGMRERGDFTQHDTMLGLTTLSFDISVAEMFLPMVVGGKTAIVDRRTAKDGHLLLNAIEKHKPTFMQATPSTFRFLIDAGWQGAKNANFRIVSTGEPLPRDLVQPLLDRCDTLWNWYGPTETTVWSSRFEVSRAEDRVLIGTPWENTNLYIVDAQDQLLGVEQEGELLIGGEGVTLGYLNREALSAEKFIQFRGERVYRTGDLAKFTADDQIECLGRIDSQVKLHGHRIELEEIEALLASHASVNRAATTVREDVPGDKRLIGYLIPTADVELDLADVRKLAEEKLPDYMVPSALVVLDEFPTTPSGKLDRNALPKPTLTRPDIGPYLAPRNDRESELAAIWTAILQLDKVGIEDNFFQIGGNSILALKAIARMQNQLGLQLNAPELFDNPTIAQITKYVDQKSDVATLLGKKTNRSLGSDEFAIIGMAARFPGAADVREFWENLCDGKESITFFSPEELDPTLPSATTSDPSYVPARGIVADADKFDAPFFGMNPRETQLIDPQQRVMLEVAWSALEDAGCLPENYAGTFGVWAGSYSNTYFTKNILTNPELIELTGEFQMGVYNEKDFIATRLAHKLNLTGPAINLNTACSTSLVTVIEACNSLSKGHCDVALAGGSSITFPQNSGHTHQTGNIMSPDGHCRPFDKQAAGTLFSDGVGMVVLKRLADAIQDGDRIYAVVKGTGINNDGGEKASFTAPSIQGQASAIAMALAHADVPIESIGYIEAHGTATPIGDPIEVQALTSVFVAQTDERQFCALGSVKGNIGHTVAAAGVAGLIKTSLSLFHEQIPPTLHYAEPNPQIDFESSPFFVCDTLHAWPRNETPRRAGVSSFGVGGTNAHILLEEAPVAATNGCVVPDNTSNSIPIHLLPISAKSEAARTDAIGRLQQFLEQASDNPNTNTNTNNQQAELADYAFTLQTKRAKHRHRAFALAADFQQAVEVLGKQHPPTFAATENDGTQREVVFMFPGQGSQYVWMGKNLYDHSSVFRDAMDQCCDILTPLLGRDLRDVLYPADGNNEAAAEILRATQFTQPAIFALGYSLAQLWKSWGVKPVALLGHSIGEFVAACLAGVFSLEDGLRMIAERGRLMQSLPGGSMLSVRAPASEIESYIQGQMSIASYNGPSLCVIAGPDEDIERVRQQLDAKDIVCKPLHTSHAFHSPMMDAIVEPYRAFVSQITLHAPTTPIMSTVNGDWMTDQQATDPNYWAQHMRAAVAYSQAVQKLWDAEPTRVLLELGPRRTLATLARQHAADKKTQHSVASLTDNADGNAEWLTILAAAGQLWMLGLDLDWQALHAGQTRQTTSLPTYPFQRKRFFVEPKTLVPATAIASTTTVANTAQASPVQTGLPTSLSPIQTTTITSETQVTATRRDQIVTAVEEILENTSGIDLVDFDASMTFFEMGMDSLVLTQTAASMKKELGVNVSFRQMLEEMPTVGALVDFLDGELPRDRFVDVVEEVVVETPNAGVPSPNAITVNASEVTAAGVPAAMNLVAGANPLAAFTPAAGNDSGAQAIIQSQLQIMQWQLQVLSGSGSGTAATPGLVTPANIATATNGVAASTAASPAAAPTTTPNAPASSGSSNAEGGAKKTFGAGARVNLNSDQLTPDQQQALDTFISQYVERTPESKAYAQRHRKYMADPRTVSGFRPSLKEMTYPLVMERSQGAYLWDTDGNEYIDVTCGFGSNFLGHTIDFMVDAMTEQLKTGYEIGPQTPLAGEVAKLFCELTGAERCAFANTGSEAVLGATRLARTATGRDLIVMFTGDYHGILDEVIVRGNKKLKSFPAATGIPGSHVNNTLILEYGSDEALQIIKENLDDIAAIVVETVQSRRPEYQPREFLHKLHEITKDEETALIFDEVITGFRIAAGGAQEHFGIQADLATYGKIVGGGMPIGMVAGKAKYMDGLDGGFWEFGDDSKPEAGMTYFAGTFVRHPVTMAAAKRILEYIRDEKDEIYDRINGLTDRLAGDINAIFKEQDVPLFFAHFGSLFKVQFEAELPYGELFFASLRSRGIHIWDHRPCLLTLSHTEADIDNIVAAFRDTVLDMKANGFLPTRSSDGSESSSQSQTAAVSSLPNTTVCNKNAKPGKDKHGNPAWFVPDANNPGQFIQVPAPK